MRACRKANLVVDDDMDGSAGAIPTKRREGKGLADNTLSSKGGIAMQQNAQDLSPLSIVALLLFCPYTANHDRIDNFQMRWVRREAEMHLRLIELPVGRCAHVIFHITGSTSFLRIGRVAKKFGNNGTKRLCQNIMQNIQPSAMRHANDNLAKTKLAAPFEDLFKRRNDRLAAIQTKPFGPGIFLVKISLKLCSIDKTLINGLLATQGEISLVANCLNAFLDPRFLRRILNVHEFNTDRAAIGLAELSNNLAQRCSFQTQHIIDENGTVPIIITKAVGLRIKFRMKRLVLQCQRIKIGNQMAANTISPNQHHCPQ